MPDRIYVEMIPYEETVTASGIHLPAEKLDHDKLVKGQVVALGPGRTLPKSGQLVPFDVEPGDVIYCGVYAGSWLDDGGSKRFLKQDEIAAKESA